MGEPIILIAERHCCAIKASYARKVEELGDV